MEAELKFESLSFVYYSFKNEQGQNVSGYHMYGLTKEGQVYKSIPRWRNIQHRGWLKITAVELPADHEAQEDLRKDAERIKRCVRAVSKNEARLARSRKELDQANLLAQTHLTEPPERAQAAFG